MSKSFDVVIWVVVSKDLQLAQIQEKIGEKIGLVGESWPNKSCEDKALNIFKILRKKFILLLDDIWEPIDLIKLGVPFPSKELASKVVFTTRSIDVCGLMEAHKKFKVKCLKDEEAWKLFRNKVGEDNLNGHPDIPELARTVAKECGGLPLALKTVGRAMACRKTPDEWRYAIHLLRRSSSEFLGMEKEVYPLLKFSYDSLPNDTIRSCLLYCSLFPEDYCFLKDDLVDCWIGEGLLAETDSSEIRNQGYYVIGVLVHACLLEEARDVFVKMHDVIRDIALWLACEIERQENFLVCAGAGLTEAPEIKKWEGVKRVSLMNNKIKNLSEAPSCPALLTLFLETNSIRLNDSNFFRFMHSLRVLNLTNNSFLTELPLGISKLVWLQSLDLSVTGIKELPKQLKSLVNLRHLSLEFTCHLQRLPRQLTSSFTELQVLKLFGWDALKCDQTEEDNILFDGGELLVEELLGLKHLNKLTVTLKSCHALQRFLSSQKLENCTQSLYLLCFGDSKLLDLFSIAYMDGLLVLEIAHCNILEELKIGNIWEIQRGRQPHAFRCLETVCITSCRKLKDSTWLVYLPNLKYVYIKYCSDMEEIISVRKLGEGLEIAANLNPFPKLQYLTLTKLPKLKSIYCKALPFPRGIFIEISKCPELKKLPLDSNRARQRKIIIRGEEDWWKKLQWEDETAQNAFLPFFTEIN